MKRTAALIAIGLIGLLTLYAPVASLLFAEQGYSQGLQTYWVNPGRCNTSYSGTVGAGTNGLTTAGASATPVVQVNASSTGSHTVTFVCNITPPNAIITAGAGLAIVDAVFAYNPVNYLATQSATLASGTMNSALVFSTISYPTPAAGETASTVTPVRADSGTLTILPAVASWHATTNTAGSFYTARFTPATPIAWKTNLVQLLLTVRMVAQVGLETTVNSPGVLIHYRGQ